MRSGPVRSFAGALALGWVACATITNLTHVGAQERFERLFLRKQGCPAGAGGAACRASAEEELLELADSARRWAAEAGDERDRIRLLRVAGTAAWQGGPEGVVIATRVSEDTVPRCRSIEELSRTGQTQPAPADCALLEILPGLVAHTHHLQELAPLEALRPTEGGRQALARIVDHYPPETFLFVQQREEWAKAYEALGPRGRTYVESAKRVLFCDYTRVRDTVESHDLYRKALEQSVEDRMARAGELTGLDFSLDCGVERRLDPPEPF